MHQKLYRNNFGGQRRSLQDMEDAMGALLDECCATDIASSEGLGCDNMTAIIVEIGG